MIDDLIYDIGMNNGDDTAYYLNQGFRVLAVEAIPSLAESARERFAEAIEEQRLTILNVGIQESAGKALFWVHSERSEWSSFDKAMVSRFGGEVVAHEVECVSFREILKQHGVPYYLKIDIEGSDELCLEALSKSDLPKYVSVEAHSLTPLCQLKCLGYSRFKCINQYTHNNPEQSVNRGSDFSRALSEVVTCARQSVSQHVAGKRVGSLLKLPRRVVRSVVRRISFRQAGEASEPAVSGEQDGFSSGSSGPFGEETYGDWSSFEEVAYHWLHLNLGYPHRSNYKRPGWFDFHAVRD